MKLRHETELHASPQAVWDFLQDTRAVVACMPGTELVDDLGGDRYHGLLRIAVGPLKMNYSGDVAVVQRDPDSRRIVLNATGRDRRGSGAVRAQVQLQVEPAERGSRLDVVSDVDLSGRIASLGRGVRDVSNRMFLEFAGQVGSRVEEPGGAVPSVTVKATAGHGDVIRNATVRESVRVAGTTTEARQIKLMPLLWAVSRERLADFLDRISMRVRPHS